MTVVNVAGEKEPVLVPTLHPYSDFDLEGTQDQLGLSPAQRKHAGNPRR